MSKNVKYSTTQKTGLNVGCYRIKDHDNVQERIVIITDNGGDIPVKVTNLERDHKQIEVSKNLKNSTPLRLILPGGGGLTDSDLVDMPNNAASGNKPKNKNAKKGTKRKKDDFIVESDEEEEEVVLSSDSDDPSWGSSKRKNANRGKKKRK